MLTRSANALRIVRQGAVVAYSDFRSFYTWRTWLGGWLVRILCQVTFYSLLAQRVGDPNYVAFVVLGAAMMVSVAEVQLTVASTTWDRNLGTLPLVAGSPAEPGLFFAGRSLQWPTSGVVTTSIAILTLSPAFDITWSLAQLPAVILLVILSTFATYCVALVVGSAAVIMPGARNVMSSVATMATTCFCGAIVPVDYWPAPLPWLAQVLPVTHGLSALRDLQSGAGASEVAVSAALTAALGLCWLAVALLAFRRLFSHARSGATLLA